MSSSSPLTSELNSCQRLAQVSTKGWSLAKMQKSEQLCNDALLKHGITPFQPNKNDSDAKQLESIFEYLVKKGKTPLTDASEATIHAAELTALIVRVRRRFDLLDAAGKNFFKNSTNPGRKALYKTATTGVLSYPPLPGSNSSNTAANKRSEKGASSQRNRNDYISDESNYEDDYGTWGNGEDQEDDEARDNFRGIGGGEMSKLSEEKQRHRRQLDQLESLEHEAQELRRRRTEIIEASSKSDHKEPIAGLMKRLSVLELSERRLRQRQQTIIKQMKNNVLNGNLNDREREKLNKSIGEYKVKLTAASQENSYLKRENGTLLATKSEHEDTLAALAGELQKLKLENYYLQEVILELQKTQPPCYGDVGSRGGGGNNNGNGNGGSQQQNGNGDEEQRRKLQQKLEADKMTLSDRIQEATKMQEDWEKLLAQQKRQRDMPMNDVTRGQAMPYDNGGYQPLAPYQARQLSPSSGMYGDFLPKLPTASGTSTNSNNYNNYNNTYGGAGNTRPTSYGLDAGKYGDNYGNLYGDKNKDRIFNSSF